jgi:hypothetical protein
MDDATAPDSLTELLDRITSMAADSSTVSAGDVLDAIGRRSFSPVLLLAGLIMLAPIIGDIPGVPVLMGLVVIVVAIQMMLGREHVWIPSIIEKRSVSGRKLTRTVSWLEKPARFVDRWTKRRLEWLLQPVIVHVFAVSLILIAATTPALELVPFSANLAGLAITAFALAIFARDGLIALFAVLFSASVVALLVWQFL